MKALLALTLLLTLGATAQAMPTPIETPRLTPAPDEIGMFVGAAGAMLESDYFRAPQTPVASGSVFPCRLQVFDKAMFDKTRLAQACH